MDEWANGDFLDNLSREEMQFLGNKKFLVISKEKVAFLCCIFFVYIDSFTMMMVDFLFLEHAVEPDEWENGSFLHLIPENDINALDGGDVDVYNEAPIIIEDTDDDNGDVDANDDDDDEILINDDDDDDDDEEIEVIDVEDEYAEAEALSLREWLMLTTRVETRSLYLSYFVSFLLFS